MKSKGNWDLYWTNVEINNHIIQFIEFDSCNSILKLVYLKNWKVFLIEISLCRKLVSVSVFFNPNQCNLRFNFNSLVLVKFDDNIETNIFFILIIDTLHVCKAPNTLTYGKERCHVYHGLFRHQIEQNARLQRPLN